MALQSAFGVKTILSVVAPPVAEAVTTVAQALGAIELVPNAVDPLAIVCVRG